MSVQLSRPVHSYLDKLLRLAPFRDAPPVSVVLFGSALRAAAADRIGDIDLIIVVPDHASVEDRRRIHQSVRGLEISELLRAPEADSKSRLELIADRAAGHAMSCFVCTRSDLLSGSVRRILELRAAEAIFVDRILLCSILASAVTVTGEDLLPQVPRLPLRRTDLFKALCNFLNRIVMSALAFPLLPNATQYAAGALKHSVHSCYFCYHGYNAPLRDEVNFFESRFKAGTFEELFRQREHHRPSFRFVLRCAPAVLRLHMLTSRENRFPKTSARP